MQSGHWTPVALLLAVLLGACDTAVYETVSVEVAGHAHYTGTATFTLESDDQLGAGFLVT